MRKGFTLIELLVVVAILAILGTIIYGAVHHDSGGVKGTETIAPNSRMIVENNEGKVIYDSRTDGKYNVQWGN